MLWVIPITATIVIVVPTASKSAATASKAITSTVSTAVPVAAIPTATVALSINFTIKVRFLFNFVWGDFIVKFINFLFPIEFFIKLEFILELFIIIFIILRLFSCTALGVLSVSAVVDC